jgi:hypothetical protein
MESVLFSVSPTDPATYLAASTALVAAAALASYLPAHRATRINPVEARSPSYSAETRAFDVPACAHLTVLPPRPHNLVYNFDGRKDVSQFAARAANRPTTKRCARPSRGSATRSRPNCAGRRRSSDVGQRGRRLRRSAHGPAA